MVLAWQKDENAPTLVKNATAKETGAGTD